MNSLKFEIVRGEWLHPELNIGRDPGYRDSIFFSLNNQEANAIVAFLSSDAHGTETCREWIHTIRLASIHPIFLVESFANACRITVNPQGVRIENIYTDDITELGLADMQIILEKWLEFLENGEPIEFSWETPVKKYIYDESIDAYVPAPE